MAGWELLLLLHYAQVSLCLPVLWHSLGADVLLRLVRLRHAEKLGQCHFPVVQGCACQPAVRQRLPGASGRRRLEPSTALRRSAVAQAPLWPAQFQQPPCQCSLLSMHSLTYLNRGLTYSTKPVCITRNNSKRPSNNRHGCKAQHT